MHRDKGDLSENAEYAAAKEAQGMLELRISKLEDIVARSRILDESKIDTSSVRLLNRVKIKNKTNNSVMEYLIVPESEANFKLGKIAVSSPIAQGLIGKKVGDIVKIKVLQELFLLKLFQFQFNKSLMSLWQLFFKNHQWGDSVLIRLRRMKIILHFSISIL